MSNVFASVLDAGIQKALKNASRHLNMETQEELLGPSLSRYAKGGTGKSLLELACYADGLRVVFDALLANGKITSREVEVSKGFLGLVASQLAKVRSQYAGFANLSVSDMASFLKQYRDDVGAFGYKDESTRWSGVLACANIGNGTGDYSAYQALCEALVQGAKTLLMADGMEEKEKHYLENLGRELGATVPGKITRNAKRGLTVTNITPTAPEASSTPFDQTPWSDIGNASTLPSVTLDQEPEQSTFVDSTNETMRHRFALGPLILSGTAVVIATAALVLAVVSLIRDPLGKGIDGYDFSTPQASAKSIFKIKAGRDIGAFFDLNQLLNQEMLGDPNEVVRTLEINRVADFEDQKVVFVSYLLNGKKRKEHLGFEKNLESKKWEPRNVSRFEVKETNEQLAKEMEEWVAKDSDESDLRKTRAKRERAR